MRLMGREDLWRFSREKCPYGVNQLLFADGTALVAKSAEKTRPGFG